ncbi:MAG: Trk family potassium uptake protein [Dehalococcoidales bacterium]|nr:Trk family potassium uptake protein [Dehalococcoidales bacterium]
MQEDYSQKPADRYYRPARRRNRPWRVLLPALPKPKTGSSSSLVLVYGFAGLIILGTLLLMLPVSSKTGDFTSFINALFTSTSAVCVTGLVVVDTADYWTPFGQVVILILIQLGGFGFMTSATIFMLAFGRRIGIQERLLISESMGLTRLGGLVTIVKRMAMFTITAELLGAVIMLFSFSGEYSGGKAAWISLFQSVSAFNNAGFDLFGGFRSLSGHYDVPLVLITTAALIILGGISFLVISDIAGRRKWKRFSLDTKIVLSATAVLLIFGFILVFFTELGDPDTLGFMSIPQKLVNAFFQSVTARTAGFSTINVANLADYALFFTMLFMFVGAASGSTAGGVKVNTFGIIVATMWSSLRGREKAGAFGRRFNTLQVHRALTVIIVSLTLISVIVFILTITEEFRFLNLLFETISAFGTVGLSTGITPDLSVAGRLVITFTMFVGRLGPLTLALALIQRQKTTAYNYPEEMIRIG